LVLLTVALFGEPQFPFVGLAKPILAPFFITQTIVTLRSLAIEDRVGDEGQIQMVDSLLLSSWFPSRSSVFQPWILRGLFENARSRFEDPSRSLEELSKKPRSKPEGSAMMARPILKAVYKFFRRKYTDISKKY